MKRRGSLVWWAVGDRFQTTKQRLQELGFEDITPANDFRTSLIKAVKKVKKDMGLDHGLTGFPKANTQHHRYLDTPERCEICIYKPTVVDGEPYYVKLCKCILDKDSGHLDVDVLDIAFAHRVDALRNEYRIQREAIDAVQFRLLVKKLIVGTGQMSCNGISMRPVSGGVYYVDARFDDRFNAVRELFRNIDTAGGYCRLDSVPIFNTTETAEALEYATTIEIKNAITKFEEKLAAEVKKGMSPKRLAGRKREAEGLISRIRTHSENLTASAEAFNATTENYIKVMNDRIVAAAGKTVEPFDLGQAIADL